MKIKEFISINHVGMVSELYLQQDYEVRGEKINLWDKGWRFKFDNAKKRFGSCSPRRKMIQLSKPICELNLKNAYEIVNTILHEIAHALQYERDRYTSHDHRWRNIARSIGCDGSRCYSQSKVNTPKGKYTLVCPSCGRETQMARKIKNNKSCGRCSGGRYNPKYKLEVIKNY